MVQRDKAGDGRQSMGYNGLMKRYRPPLRVGISGKMRSGKDTIAEYMVRNHGFVRVALADRLKELACEMFGMRAGAKNRSLLITLGRKMCEVDPFVFVNAATRRMPLNENVVVPDVRYPYEFNALKALGFKMVRINIAREKQEARVLATEPDTSLVLLDDLSETALDAYATWDMILDGGASFGDIETAIQYYLVEWRAE